MALRVRAELRKVPASCRQSGLTPSCESLVAIEPLSIDGHTVHKSFGVEDWKQCVSPPGTVMLLFIASCHTI